MGIQVQINSPWLWLIKFLSTNIFNLAEVNPQPTKVKIKIPNRLYILFSIIIFTSKGLVASDKAS